VIVTDGERALQHRVVETFTDITLVLDFLHALDKLCLHCTLTFLRWSQGLLCAGSSP
jgi:hypothetical protein